MASVAPGKGRPEGPEERSARGLADRFLKDDLSADLGHPAVALTVALLLKGEVATTALVAWFVIITAVSAGRALARRRLAAAGAEPDRVRAVLGSAAVLTAAAWGVGVLVLAPGLDLTHLAVLMVAFAGLSAAATTTLIPYPTAFYGFMAVLFLPLGVTIVRSGQSAEHVALVIMEGLFAGVMTVLYRRNHEDVVGQIDTATRLGRSQLDVARERDFASAVIRTAPVAIAIEDSGGLREVNPAFLEALGLDEEEALGTPVSELVEILEDREGARDFLQAAAGGSSVTGEFHVRHPSGRSIWLEVAAAPGVGVAQGTVVYMALDVTARRQAEEALRAAEEEYRGIVEASSDLIWRVDREGRFTYLNPVAAEIYGRPPRDLLGTPFMELTAPERRQEDIARFELVMGGHPLRDHETVHLAANGDRKVLSFSGRAVRGAGGEVTGAQGTARDVTRRVEERKALEAARDAAERAARARTAFLASMSHEIRTPMNGVLGMLAILTDTDLDPEQREAVATARASGQALMVILNDILDLSKIEAGQLELEDIPFDLSDVLGGALRVLNSRAAERGVELRLDVGTEVPLWCRGDPTRLRQVVMNLVGNAVKFTEAGAITVRVRLLGASPRGPVARFSVLDTGVGIADEGIERIFRPFGQADSSVSRAQGGTGLGLSISRRLVELMGGDLSVVSRPGEGSEFWFTIALPFADVDPTARLEAPSVAGARILIVDAHATSRRVLREAVLRAHGRPIEASDKAGALDLLRAGASVGDPVEVVVLDWRLGDGEGLDLARAMSADPVLAEIRIAALVAAAHPDDGALAREAGVAACLTKPVSGASLLAGLESLLRGDGGGAAEGARSPVGRTPADGPIRILMAEDNLVNQQVGRALLTKRGWSVEIVADGQAALDALEEDRYDLVLMDVQMPIMDGLEATRRLRERGSTVPVVAITAHALDSERASCMEAGMDDFLTKPFTPEDLYDTVIRWARVPDDEPAAHVPHDDKGDAMSQEEGVPVHLEAFRAVMREAGIEEVVEPSISAFLDDAPSRMEELASALDAADPQRVAAVAHALKSGCRNLRADDLADLLEELERAGTGADMEAAGRLAETVRSEYHRVEAFLLRALDEG